MNGETSSETEKSLSRFLEQISDREIFLFIGFVQGLAGWGLAENGDWLDHYRAIAYPLWLLVLAWPVLFMLSFSRQSTKRGLAWVSGYSAVLATLAAYTGWQASPQGEFDIEAVIATFAISTVVATFVALIHLQPLIWRQARDYDTLFTLSWRNFLTLGLSVALTLGVRLVLLLWETLFEAIGIEFFGQLFEEEWFILPVLAMSFAFGLHSFRGATSVIDSISSLLERLIWLLLPIVVLLSASFLISLPFTGLQALWDTDWGTFILMAANLVGLFFLNAVYQTGGRLPYPAITHKALTIGIALFPILSALACYGLSLRIAQYGWTISRCWALLIIVLMALFSIGYACIIILKREGWQERLPWINKQMSFVLLGALLLTNSPLLDFRSVSTSSYFSGFESGKVAIQDLDTRYVKSELARPGHLRMQALLASLDEADEQAALALRIKLGREEAAPGWTQAQQDQILMRPEPFAVPTDAAEMIKGHRSELPELLFRVDLGASDEPEILAVWGDNDQSIHTHCVGLRDGEWQHCGYGTHRYDTDQSLDDLLEELSRGEFQAEIPNRPYKDLRVGDLVLELE